MEEVRRVLAEELGLRFAYPSAPDLQHSTRCLVRRLDGTDRPIDRDDRIKPVPMRSTTTIHKMQLYDDDGGDDEGEENADKALREVVVKACPIEHEVCTAVCPDRQSAECT